MATETERPARGARVEENRRKLSKLWNDEALLRKAVAEAQARDRFRTWPPVGRRSFDPHPKIEP
jgi:hypothetical protein